MTSSYQQDLVFGITSFKEIQAFEGWVSTGNGFFGLASLAAMVRIGVAGRYYIHTAVSARSTALITTSRTVILCVVRPAVLCSKPIQSFDWLVYNFEDIIT